jgi:hypothetical protein
MGWWQPGPDLNDDESVLWRALANRAQDAAAQPGGILVVTERRVVFTPGRVDSMMGGRPWWSPRGAITAVEEVPRTAGLHFGAAAAGNRRRMRLRTAHGGEELFMVYQVRRKVPELRSLLGLAEQASWTS